MHIPCTPSSCCARRGILDALKVPGLSAVPLSQAGSSSPSPSPQTLRAPCAPCAPPRTPTSAAVMPGGAELPWALVTAAVGEGLGTRLGSRDQVLGTATVWHSVTADRPEGTRSCLAGECYRAPMLTRLLWSRKTPWEHCSCPGGRPGHAWSC